MSMRKIHLGKDVWEYKIGKSNIVIFSPTREKTVISYTDVPGWDEWFESEVEKEPWTYLSFEVTPGKIKAYIEQNLTG